MDKTPTQINHYAEMIAHVSPWSKKAGQVPTAPLDVLQDEADALGIEGPSSVGGRRKAVMGDLSILDSADDTKVYPIMGGEVSG